MPLYEAKARMPEIFATPGDIVDISEAEAKRFGDLVSKAPKGAKATVINKPGKAVVVNAAPKTTAPTGAGDEGVEGDEEPTLTDVKGIGSATATKLTDAGIETVADLEAAITQKNEDIVAILGGEEKAVAIQTSIDALTGE